MDDNLADYRRFCANRLRRLERCKKTKSFCNLDDDVLPTANSGPDILPKSENFAPCGSAATFSGSFPTIPAYSGIKTIESGSAVESKVLSLAATNSWLQNQKFSPMMIRTVATAVRNQNGNCDNGGPSLSLSSHPSSSSSPSSSSLSPPPSSSSSSSLTTTVTTTATTTTITEQKLAKTKMTNDDNNESVVDESDRIKAQKKFDLLREKMISLMENDVRLLQQLLALGDSIQELKSRNQADRNSRISLNSLNEEDDDEEWSGNRTAFSNSLSAVTNLYVDDEPNENQNTQYFSRKNSVLRIPIPPRSSNRMSTNKKLQRRLSRLSQHYHEQQQQQQENQQRLEVVENSSQTEDGIVSKQDFDPLPIISSTPSNPASTLTLTAATSTGTETMVPAFGTINTRISNGSIDSGIRDESCSNSSAGSLSPTLKDEKF